MSTAVPFFDAPPIIISCHINECRQESVMSFPAKIAPRTPNGSGQNIPPYLESQCRCHAMHINIMFYLQTLLRRCQKLGQQSDPPFFQEVAEKLTRIRRAGSLQLAGSEKIEKKPASCQYYTMASADNDFDLCRTTFLLTVYTRSWVQNWKTCACAPGIAP